MRSLCSFSRLVFHTLCAVCAVLWLWCCVSVKSYAQPQSNIAWEQTNGPDGGYVRCFAASVTSIFAGTNYNGGVFRSTDNGASWSPVNTGLPLGIDTRLVVNALLASGGNVFAATSSGIFRSTNNGASWTLVGEEVKTIAINALAANNGTLYAGTNTGLLRSTDNGNSWSAVNTGLLPTRFTSLAVLGGTIFAGANGIVIYSADDGVSWTAARLNSFIPATVRSFAASSNMLFAGTNGGVFRSDDNGKSWVVMNTGLGFTIDINSVAVSGNTVFASGNYGLFRSTNNGASWLLVNTGSIHNLENTLLVNGSTIFLGRLGGVLRSTDNGNSWSAADIGLKGTHITTLAKNGNALFAGTFWGSGVFQSTDNGSIWTNVLKAQSSDASAGVTTIVPNGRTIFVGTWSGGAFRSTDNGASWMRIGRDVSGRDVLRDIRSFLVSGNAVFVGTAGTLFRSIDNGTTWTEASNGLPIDNGFSLPVHRAFAVKGDTIFVAREARGIYRSANNGASWTAVNNGLMGNDVLSFYVNGNTIFAGTGKGGIFRSTDNGTSWTAVNTGLTNNFSRTVNDFAMIGNTLFAGTEGGVFRTVNNGRTWTALNTGLTNLDVRSLAAVGNTLFAGTYGSGVFRATIPSIIPELIANPEQLSLGSTLFNGTTTGATFTVIGANLSAPVSIAAPLGVLLLNPATRTWGRSLTLPINAAGSTEQSVAVRLDSSRVGLVGRIGTTGTLAFISVVSDTLSAQVQVSGEVLPRPLSLSTNPQQISLGNIILNSRTSTTTFTVTGIGLGAPVSITAPNGVLLLNPTTGTWTQSLSLALSTTGSVQQILSVRLDSSRLGLLGRIGMTGTPAFINVASDTLSARVQVSGLVREAPQLVATPDSLFFGTLRVGNAAPFTLPSERRYTLVGTNLTDTLIITAPVGAQIFDTVSNSWQSTIRFPITLAPFSGSLRTTLTVRIDSTRLGAISSLVRHESGPAQASVRLTGDVLPMPRLQALPENLSFPSIVQGDSVGTREYVLTGTNLPANVVVTAPEGFLVLNPATNAWVRSFTLATSGTGSVMQRIFVRMDSLLVRTFSNVAITHLSGTATFSTQATVLVSGSIVPLTLPADAETTLELRLLTPRQPLLVRDTARVQIWLKDTRLTAPPRLHSRIIGRFLKTLRTTFKLDTNNLTVLGLRTTPATKARLETMPQTPRTTPFTSLVVERVDTSTTRELLLAEVQLLATLGVATTNTFRIAQPTLWLESAAGLRWTLDTARIEFLTVFAPPQTAILANTVTAGVAPNPSAGEVEISYTLSRSTQAETQETVPLVLLITDMAGRTIQRVELGQRTTGEVQKETVNVRGLVAGTYRVVLIAPNETMMGRVNVVR